MVVKYFHKYMKGKDIYANAMQNYTNKNKITIRAQSDHLDKLQVNYPAYVGMTNRNAWNTL